MIQRGFNNTFYYVETEQAQASAAIYQFKCDDYGRYANSKKIHEVSNGKVLALELDADHMLKNQDRSINGVNIYEEKIVLNELFLLDEKLQMTQLK